MLDGPVRGGGHGSTLYAGSFNNAWPNTGSSAVDLASGVPDGGAPEINGEVIAAARTAGGWFIGGISRRRRPSAESWRI